MNLSPNMVKHGMTGTYDCKKFKVIGHVTTGELYKGESINNEMRNKIWVEWDGKTELFCLPLIMTVADWKELFDQPPTP